MSLILKGIDLPTEDQVIVIHSDGTFNEVDPFARRLMPFYEAIQIPTPHGRLIDGDDLISDLRTYESKYCGEQGYITQDDIIDAPIILEAER